VAGAALRPRVGQPCDSRDVGGLPRPPRQATLRWRDYETASGNRPVKKFLMDLTSDDRAEVVAAMEEVAEEGLNARHLRGEIYEVRATGENRAFRVLFAVETKFILLSLEGFSKTTQRTPPSKIEAHRKNQADIRGPAEW